MENIQNPGRNLPRDVFLYLLAVVALGMVAVNFGVLLFQYINVYVPDVVADRYLTADVYYGSIRWAVATLIIVFPVFIWVWRFLKRDIAANPEKREMRVRKWLLYLTLFVASVVIIGDLVALVYNFLQGELTTRFVLKMLAILSISGSIFYYYLNELRDNGRPTGLFARAVIAVVAIAVIAGFFVAGLPASQRLVRLDDQRVQDLQNVQSQVIQYWQSKSRLPAGLADLRNDISGFVPPADPVTNAPYEYNVEGGLKFQLCATFQTTSKAAQPNAPKAVPAGSYYDQQSNWQHDTGRVCFERTIDPDLYPPAKFPKPL